MAIYIGLPNYRRNLLNLGFEEADFEDGGSDKLVDGVVAWGDMDVIRERVAQHHAAGADHVCLQVVGPDMNHVPTGEWEQLAAALL